jgi:hypothetical protein
MVTQVRRSARPRIDDLDRAIVDFALIRPTTERDADIRSADERKESVVTELSYILERAIAIATLTAPMVLVISVLVAYGRGMNFGDPVQAPREEDPAPRWRLDR